MILRYYKVLFFIVHSDFKKLLFFKGYLCYALAQVFLFCIFGNRLIEESSSVMEAAYSCHVSFSFQLENSVIINDFFSMLVVRWVRRSQNIRSDCLPTVSESNDDFRSKILHGVFRFGKMNI